MLGNYGHTPVFFISLMEGDLPGEAKPESLTPRLTPGHEGRVA